MGLGGGQPGVTRGPPPPALPGGGVFPPPPAGAPPQRPPRLSGSDHDGIVAVGGGHGFNLRRGARLDPWTPWLKKGGAAPSRTELRHHHRSSDSPLRWFS